MLDTTFLTDTHIQIWWILGDNRLKPKHQKLLDEFPVNNRPELSAISLWEITSLYELGRIELDVPLDDWFDVAAHPRTVSLQPINSTVAREIAKSPPGFIALLLTASLFLLGEATTSRS